MKFAAQLIACKRGQDFGGGFLSRWKHEVQVAIQRRRAAMARSVLPRLTKEELWLLSGCVDSGPSEHRRQLPLEEDETLDFVDELDEHVQPDG